MKIAIEVNSPKDIDYAHFIDWLNDQIAHQSFITWYGVEATIISVDGENKY